MPSSPTYQSYLLRFWRATPQSAWQASLQCTATDAHYTFRELSDLFSFLAERMILSAEISVVTDEDPRSCDA